MFVASISPARRRIDELEIQSLSWLAGVLWYAGWLVGEVHQYAGWLLCSGMVPGLLAQP